MKKIPLAAIPALITIVGLILNFFLWYPLFLYDWKYWTGQ